MLIKDISYVDPFTEEEVTRKYYFNLTQAELIELQYSVEGSQTLSDILEKIISEKRNTELIPYFRKIIAMSVGDRLDDGSFVKNDAIRDRFMSSEAYSNLLMSMFEVDNLLAFIKGIMPKDIVTEINKQIPEGLDNPAEVIKKFETIKGGSDAVKNNN